MSLCEPILSTSLKSSAMNPFRELSPKEEREFRQWARNNYLRHTPIKGVWHPVIQDECVRINQMQPPFAIEEKTKEANG